MRTQRRSARLLRLPLGIVAAVLLAGLASACGAPAGSDGQGTASVAPRSTVAPGSPPAAENAPLQLFLQRYSDPRASYHGKFTMNLGTARTHIVLSGEMDAVGTDWKGPVTVQVDKQALELDVVRKDGTTYARSGSGKWTVVRSNQAVGAAPQPFDPMRGANELVDVGMADRNGRHLHWLQMKQLTDPAPLQRSMGTTARIDNFSYNVYVDDGGVPIETVLTLQLFAPSGHAAFSVRFQLSDYGKPVVVTAPHVAAPTASPQPAG